MREYVFFILISLSIVSVQGIFAEETEMVQGIYMHFPVGEKFFQYKTNPHLALSEEIQNRCWFIATFVNQEEPGKVVYQFPKDLSWPGSYENSTFFVITYETVDMTGSKLFQKIIPQYSDNDMILTFEIKKGISQLLVNSTDYFEQDNTTARRCIPLFDEPPESTDYYDYIFPPRIQKSYVDAFGFPDDSIMCKTGKELITKINGSPACVNPETKGKLIQRGWAMSDLDLV